MIVSKRRLRLEPEQGCRLASACLFQYRQFMASAISNIEKSKRGRPRTDATPVMVRLQPEQLGKLDAWIAAQNEPVSRPEAIRQILEQFLA